MVKHAIKLSVAVFLIGVLLSMVDWARASALAAQLHWLLIALIFLIMVAELTISTAKWSSALRMHGIHHPFDYLWRVLCTAFFFNNFLPTSIGGDAYRVYRTLPVNRYRSRAISAIIVERATGLAALLALGTVGAWKMFGISPIADFYLLLASLGAVGGLVGVAALYFGWFPKLTTRFRHIKAVDAFQHNIDHLAAARLGWLEQGLYSVVFQLISVGIVYLLFAQTGEALTFWQCALVTAAAILAALIPISINGIGLLEGAFVAVAVSVGANYDQALLVAFIRRFMMILLSLLCGFVYLTERRQQLV